MRQSRLRGQNEPAPATGEQRLSAVGEEPVDARLSVPAGQVQVGSHDSLSNEEPDWQPDILSDGEAKVASPETQQRASQQASRASAVGQSTGSARSAEVAEAQADPGGRGSSVRFSGAQPGPGGDSAQNSSSSEESSDDGEEWNSRRPQSQTTQGTNLDLNTSRDNLDLTPAMDTSSSSEEDAPDALSNPNDATTF